MKEKGYSGFTKNLIATNIAIPVLGGDSMGKIIGCIFLFSIMVVPSSCTLLQLTNDVLQMAEDVNTFDTKNDDESYPGNVKIYIENRAKEIIVVYDYDFFRGVELARIPMGGVQLINIKKGKTIYASGGSTKRPYSKIICDTDQEKYPIY
jgi:hypothetical protein